MTVAYGDAAVAYEENNAAVIAANKATAEYNAAMAELGGEVEPLNTAMTNLKTTLVGAVTPAVSGLSNWLANLINNLVTADEKTDLLSQEQRAIVTAADEAAEAYKRNKEAAWEMAEAELANVGHAESLIKQLQGLVDENGNVLEGEEARAEFILGQLNTALGEENLKLKDIFNSNGEIKQSIYDLIEAKKAQIMLSAYEDTYAEAVKNVATQEHNRVIKLQELAMQEGVVAEKREALNAASEAYNKAQEKGLALTGAELASHIRAIDSAKIQLAEEEGILTDKQAAYNETEDLLYQYYANIKRYEDASTAMIAGNVDEVIKHLDRMGEDGFKTAESTVALGAENQRKILEQQVIDTAINAELMAQNYEDGVEGVTEEMVKTAKEQAEAAKKEFEKVGEDITEGIGDGAESKKDSLWSSMSNVVSTALAAAKKAAGIESPSKLFRDEVGHYMGEGVAVGVDKSTADVVRSINRQVNAALDAYDVGEINAAITGGINTRAGQKNGSGGLASGSNGGVTIYQTNNYSQAHSRYEIYKSKQDAAAAVRLAMQR